MHLVATTLSSESLRVQTFENLIQDIVTGARKTISSNGIGEATQSLAIAENHPYLQGGETGSGWVLEPKGHGNLRGDDVSASLSPAKRGGGKTIWIHPTICPTSSLLPEPHGCNPTGIQLTWDRGNLPWGAYRNPSVWANCSTLKGDDRSCLKVEDPKK